MQTDNRCRVAVLSITAASVGITLTAASLCIFAEMYWTPGVLAQAEARLHRISQEDVVQVRYLVLEDSVDNVMWGMIKNKHEVLTKTLGDEAEILLEADKKIDVMQPKIVSMLQPVARSVPISPPSSKPLEFVAASSPAKSPKEWSRQTTLNFGGASSAASPVRKEILFAKHSSSPAALTSSPSVEETAPPGFVGYRLKSNQFPTRRISVPLGSTFERVVSKLLGGDSNCIPTSIMCLGKKFGLEEAAPNVNDALIVLQLSSVPQKRSESEVINIDPTPAKKAKMDANSTAASSPATPAAASSSKTPCQYGLGCYRKNPAHLREFYHPQHDDKK